VAGDVHHGLAGVKVPVVAATDLGDAITLEDD